MKPRFSNQRNHALTLVEVLVVIVVLAVLAVLLLPAFGTHSRLGREIDCNNNLKQIGFAFQIWKHDHDDKFPMQVSVTNGGIMEFTASGNVFASFLVLSNELQSSKILVCPADADRLPPANNFTTDFKKSKISYFIGLDADTNHLQAFLSGDDNFAIDGVPVKSSLAIP